MTAAPVLTAEQLSISRGDRVLRAGIELRVNAGELLHLRGGNGAGKTTLLETLAGLRPPQAGRVERPLAPALLWIGHRNGLAGALTPIENLQFWCRLNDQPAAAAAAALAAVGLQRQRHRACRLLSTGQRRRAALARLLIAPQPLWLLDEPFAGLDAEGIPLVGELLVTHLARGGAAVVSTHQPLPVNAPAAAIFELAA